MNGPLLAEADGERGFVFAMRLGGERALPVDRGFVLLSPDRLCRHVLVCGATGSGKTETLLRLAWTIAKGSEAHVFYLDGKGDRQSAERFCGLMADAGRRSRVFPNEPFDGWRGAPHEIHSRLMEIVDYASDGPASWYRDVAKNVLRLVCEHPDGPPRCSGQALERMDLSLLRAAHEGSSAVAALTKDQVRQVRLRYEAFFGQSCGALDGTWAWEDTQAGYLLLDSLALREETTGLARFLFEDFTHYFTTRKARGLFCVLIVDEFSALASGAGMAGRVEQGGDSHARPEHQRQHHQQREEDQHPHGARDGRRADGEKALTRRRGLRQHAGTLARPLGKRSPAGGHRPRARAPGHAGRQADRGAGQARPLAAAAQRER